MRPPSFSNAEARQALKHPLRRQLVALFLANQPLSPKEAAALTGEPLTRVSYHVHALVKFRFLVLSSREPVRGALKNYYSLNEEVLANPIVRKLTLSSLPNSS